MGTEIKITLERRPCWIDDSSKALFHCWEQRSEVIAPSIAIGGHPGGVVSGILAVVEMEDGSVSKFSADRIRFADGNGEFYEYAWFPPPKKEVK